MPPKASRTFTCDAETGEIRCKDPSCAVTQCGQCNVEQNRRKRLANKNKTAVPAAVQGAGMELKQHFQIGSRVYVREVHSVGTIRALAWNSGKSHLQGYTVVYESVEECEYAEGDHSTVEVYRLLDSAATWPEAASKLPFMSTVVGTAGVRSGSKVGSVVGCLVHACVDLQGRVHYYGVASREHTQGAAAYPSAVFYCSSENVKQHDAIPDKRNRSAINAAAEKEQQAAEQTAEAQKRLNAGWNPSFVAEGDGDAPAVDVSLQHLRNRMENLKDTEEGALQSGASEGETFQAEKSRVNWTTLNTSPC
jgi:hypothetical protein